MRHARSCKSVSVLPPALSWPVTRREAAEARERGIIGETPNLAARLQGIAEPNKVVIAEGTRRLLGDLFEVQDLGQSLRTRPGPCGRGRCCGQVPWQAGSRRCTPAI